VANVTVVRVTASTDARRRVDETSAIERDMAHRIAEEVNQDG